MLDTIDIFERYQRRKAKSAGMVASDETLTTSPGCGAWIN